MRQESKCYAETFVTKLTVQDTGALSTGNIEFG